MAKISSLQEIPVENFSGTTHLSRLQLGLPLMSKIIWHKKYGKIYLALLSVKVNSVNFSVMNPLKHQPCFALHCLI